MASSSAASSNKCRNPDCRKDSASRCPHSLCAVCCDRSDPRRPEFHNRRTKARGTNKHSEAKRQRREFQGSLAEIIAVMMLNSWFRECLQRSGYTVRKFTLALYDYVVRMASAEPTCP